MMHILFPSFLVMCDHYNVSTPTCMRFIAAQILEWKCHLIYVVHIAYNQNCGQLTMYMYISFQTLIGAIYIHAHHLKVYHVLLLQCAFSLQTNNILWWPLVSCVAIECSQVYQET